MSNLNGIVDRQQIKLRMLHWADEIRTWGIEWVTGIYPGEMAAFLGLCEVTGIQSIIESGRGEHAYSTQILGEYSERTGVRVVSIDYKPVEEKNFAARLMRYRNLRFENGDAFRRFPKAAHGLPGPIALLIDGPKLQEATKISLVACTLFDVQVVAHHNFPSDSPWEREFVEIFPGAFHYEDLDLAVDQEWQAFKRWENDWVHGYEHFDEGHGVTGRSLDQSSLVLAVLPPGPQPSMHLSETRKSGLLSSANLRSLRRKWAIAKFQLDALNWCKIFGTGPYR